MPRLIDTSRVAEAPLEPAELVELLETGGFDPLDEESIASFGPALARLGRNRRFLADLAIDELKSRCAGQVGSNQYSPQVIMVHTSPGRFALRANFWPAEEDSVFADSGPDAFAYGLAHDHNFSFLTVGYLGPGYWSDYYDYDYDAVAGFTGEAVALRFVERSRLSEGKVLLYRRLRDVHCQTPPDSLSVSLNLLALSPANDFCDQYGFDLERHEVSGIINHSPLENLVAIAGRYGGGNGRELVEDFARCHPSGRIRFAALRAAAAGEQDGAGRQALFEQAATSTDPYVAGMARRELAALDG